MKENRGQLANSGLIRIHQWLLKSVYVYVNSYDWTSSLQLILKRSIIYFKMSKLPTKSSREKKLLFAVCLNLNLNLYCKNTADITQLSCISNKKKAVLSQRWPAQCALYMGALKIFGTSWLHPRILFPKFYGLLFRWYRPKERWWVAIGRP